ncbi:lipase family protein [Mycobacterium sp. ZZG]
MTTTESGSSVGTESPDSDPTALEAFDGGGAHHRFDPRGKFFDVEDGATAATAAAPAPEVRDSNRSAPTTPNGSRGGVEVRVHGIGDHSTFSALGRPKYKELVDSRVWIGEVPPLPRHPLRLVNWSRANRQITRHLGWYLAFPFTLLNVAGYMEPPDRSRHLMRTGISVASLCLTVAMAAWISVIFETAWRSLAHGDDRLTGVLLQGVGPGILIAFVVYRMFVGRALVDRAGSMISVASILVLVGMIQFLHAKPATYPHAWIRRILTPAGDPGVAVDPMSLIIACTTGLVFIVALCLCALALWKKTNGAALAGAALLLVLAITLLHTAGSMLRKFFDSVFIFVPPKNGPPQHVSPEDQIRHVLLPRFDDLSVKVIARVPKALSIDLIPVYFLGALAVFAVVFCVELAKQRKSIALAEATRRSGRRQKNPSGTHELVVALPRRLAPPVAIGLVATAGLWVLMYRGFANADPWLIADFLVALQVAGAVAILMVVIRRPERLAARLRSIFGSVADIAGFWAPDLHPLAGASYRRALLAGIRQTINDVTLEYPHTPLALVGHSQGSVVCAWFVHGGHWTEQPTEGQSDRDALKARTHHTSNNARSDRIALFTCGSTLSTLYRTFFPRYFDDEFFVKTWGMTYKGTWWRNYWRKTDPIGSVVPTRRETDNVDVTERLEDETLGHGEYWRNERLRAGINRFFETAEIAPAVKRPDLSGNGVSS